MNSERKSYGANSGAWDEEIKIPFFFANMIP